MKKLSIFIIALLLLFCAACADSEAELSGQELADGIINGSIEMSDEDKATLRNIFNLGKFESDIGNCMAEVKVQIVGRSLTYHSECGNFNDAKNGEHFKLSDAQREVVNALLSKYVSLGEELPERTVVDIIDTTRELEIELPAVEQVFFEDENRQYIFGMPIAEYVVVKFSDGSSKQLVTALEVGDIAITDLDKYGISYFSYPTGVLEIVDRAEKEHLITSDALEYFYNDGEIKYYFGSIKSHHVVVIYSDGSEQSVKDALAEGRILISDLDTYNIGYGKEAIEN